MAEGRHQPTARVPLDAALVGQLPPVCVMTGERADGNASLVVPRSLGIAWALLLAGPVGALVLVALTPRLRVRYVVKVPMSAAAFDRWYQLRAQRLWCTALGVVGALAAFATIPIGPISGVLALASLGALFAAASAHARLPWAQPILTVDAPGRVLTMRGVHERFVQLALGQEARR